MPLQNQRGAFLSTFASLKQERQVTHLRILADFDHALNFSKLQAHYLRRDQLGDFFLKFTIRFLLFLSSLDPVSIQQRREHTVPSVRLPLKVPS